VRALSSYDYAVLQVVPNIERGERINIGVIVFCRTCAYLGLRFVIDEPRLRALAPDLDLAELTAYLRAMEQMSLGDPSAGPIAAFSQAERFHWETTARESLSIYCETANNKSNTLRQMGK